VYQRKQVTTNTSKNIIKKPTPESIEQVKLAGDKINIKKDIRDQKATITEKIKE